MRQTLRRFALATLRDTARSAVQGTTILVLSTAILAAILGVSAPARPSTLSPVIEQWSASLPAEVQARVVLVGGADLAEPLRAFAAARDRIGLLDALTLGPLSSIRSRFSAAASYGFAIRSFATGRCFIGVPSSDMLGSWGDPTANLILTLEHELGHCLDDDGASPLSSVVRGERRADAFAVLRRLSAGDRDAVERLRTLRKAYQSDDREHDTLETVVAAIAAYRPGLGFTETLNLAHKLVP